MTERILYEIVWRIWRINHSHYEERSAPATQLRMKYGRCFGVSDRLLHCLTFLAVDSSVLWDIIKPDYSENGYAMDRELVILGLLASEDMHGYQLNAYLDRQMAFCIDLKRPTVYYALEKLCRAGYVAEERERAGNRPERRTYRITSAGRDYFIELLRRNLAAYHAPHYSDDIGVIFQHHLSAAEVAAHMQTKRAAVVERREAFHLLRARMPDDRHRAVIDHHLLHLDAELRWIDTLAIDTWDAEQAFTP